MSSERNEYQQEGFAKFRKAMNELSPERLDHLDKVFKAMRSGETVQPMMRQMSFDGRFNFDYNRKQVELEGEFSKEDLLRIAAIMF